MYLLLYVWKQKVTLVIAEGPLSAEDVAGLFVGRRTSKRVAQVTELLEMLVALGQAAVGEGGRYVGV